jgi:hypothetical protein
MEIKNMENQEQNIEKVKSLIEKLEKDFPDTQFEDIDKLNIGFIDLLYKSLIFLQKEFETESKKYIFSKLNKIKSKDIIETTYAEFNPYSELSTNSNLIFEPYIAFNFNHFGLRTSLTADFQEMTILHELLHYILCIKKLRWDSNFTTNPLQELRSYVNNNFDNVKTCFDRFKNINSSELLIDLPKITEEFICESVSYYIVNINNEILLEKEENELYKPAYKFYKELKEIKESDYIKYSEYFFNNLI